MTAFPDLHMHTPLCKHATGEPEKYIEHAIKSGIKRIIFTDHIAIDDEFDVRNRMSLAQMENYFIQISELSLAYKSDLDVGVGIEADYVPGYVDCITKHLRDYDWDMVLGSIHFVPQDGKMEFIIRSSTDRQRFFLKDYWLLWGEAGASGLFDAMTHPDIYRGENRNILPGEVQMAREALDKLDPQKICIEYNMSGWRKGFVETYPADWLLEEILMRGFKMVSGSDAHHADQVGSGFKRLAEVVQKDSRFEFVDFYKRNRRSI
jgi:histidinol-phosphatase (PHP family)